MASVDQAAGRTLSERRATVCTSTFASRATLSCGQPREVEGDFPPSFYSLCRYVLARGFQACFLCNSDIGCRMVDGNASMINVITSYCRI